MAGRLEVRRDGQVFMWTNDPSCYPDASAQRSMRGAGYKIYMDGRIWRP